MDIKLARLTDLKGNVRRMDQHFGGNTAAVQAGAAEFIFFDAGDLETQTCRRGGDLRTAAGTDDNNVIVFHD